MTQLNFKDLRSRARDTLRSVDPRPLVLLFVGVLALASLSINALNVFLDHQISGTGGLSGLGLRSMLETAQQLLTYASTIFTPFWEAGFLSAMVWAMRSRSAQSDRMLDGFRRFPKVLAHTALEMAIMLGLSLLVANVASYLFMLTPMSGTFNTLMTSFLESGDLSALPMQTLVPAMAPMFVLFGVLLVPLYLYVQYHLRLSLYLLMEGAPMGALRSMTLSVRKMRGFKWQMLKLDVRFWWYYLVDGVLMIVCYLDVILPALGIALPVNETVAYFATLILYAVLQLAFHYWKRSEVELTYLHAYEEICREADADVSLPQNTAF